MRLSRTADVLVENFAPPVMPRLGLGPDAFLQVNPRLIYASASGSAVPGLRGQARPRPDDPGDERTDEHYRREEDARSKPVSRSPTSCPAPISTARS